MLPKTPRRAHAPSLKSATLCGKVARESLVKKEILSVLIEAMIKAP